MAKFNPDFWEVSLSSAAWEMLSAADGLAYESPAETAERLARADATAAVWPRVRELIDAVLTDRQREVVLLHTLYRRNQMQIAAILGISQQAVSEHLYGKVRNGHAVGGAIRKLRKACAAAGIRMPGL